MTELVVRTGSPEAVRAAVQNGAGGIKLRPEGFTPPGVKGFSLQEIGETIKYCHIRGAKVYITPGELLSDRERGRFAALARAVSTSGADALVAESYAAATLFRLCAPDVPVHGGFGLNVHDLDGVLHAREAGISRVCLSQLLDRDAIRYICTSSPIEIEIKVHGSGCPAYGAACRMGVFMDERQPGFCAGICREAYGFGMRDGRRPLSMKEICHGGHLPELLAMDPAALSIDSFTASPEYTALATGYYARAIKEVRPLSQVQMENLKNSFYSQGGTDGLYTGLGTGEGSGLWSPYNMFFAEGPGPAPAKALASARETYHKAESQRVRVRFFAAVSPGVPVTLSIEDDEGNICTVESQKPAGASPEQGTGEPRTGEPGTVKPRNEEPGNAASEPDTGEMDGEPEVNVRENQDKQGRDEQENVCLDIDGELLGNEPGFIPFEIAYAAAESGEDIVQATQKELDLDGPQNQAHGEGEGDDLRAPAQNGGEESTPEEGAQGAGAPDDHDQNDSGRRRRLSAADSALEAELTTMLYKTRGTPYRCTYARVRVDGGARLSPDVVRGLRDRALEQLSRERSALPTRATADLPPLTKAVNFSDKKPVLTVSVTRAAQLSKGMAELNPAMVCVPLFEVVSDTEALRPFLKNRNIQMVVTLPRIIWDKEMKAVMAAMDLAYALGIEHAEISNAGHFAAARSRGFRVRAGLDMDIRTTAALEQLRLEGYAGAMLSVDLEAEKISAMEKPIDTEIMVYGRIPLLTTEACLMVGRTGNCACGNRCEVTDSSGANYPVLRDGISCRNILYSAGKLYMADEPEKYEALGLWGTRLAFSTENAVECKMTMLSYLGEKGLEPNEITRGQYYAHKRL